MILIPIIAAFLYRLDGWGKGDSFLPAWPFNIDTPFWKCGGLNYTRYAIGPVIALASMNWWYLLTYSLAVSIPYGENSITHKIFGSLKWFVVGVAFGAASLSWGNALWCGVLLTIFQLFATDQAILEFGFGWLGTLVFFWK